MSVQHYEMEPCSKKSSVVQNDNVDVGEVHGVADGIDEGEFKHSAALMKIVCVKVNSVFATGGVSTLSYIRISLTLLLK